MALASSVCELGHLGVARAASRPACSGSGAGASASSVSMSSGSAITTGPGRPDVATAKARVTSSGMRAGIVDLGHPFGDAAEEAPVVDLLEGLALA